MGQGKARARQHIDTFDNSVRQLKKGQSHVELFWISLEGTHGVTVWGEDIGIEDIGIEDGYRGWV